MEFCNAGLDSINTVGFIVRISDHLLLYVKTSHVVLCAIGHSANSYLSIIIFWYCTLWHPSYFAYLVLARHV